jgi:hypothetical protein
MLEVATQLGKFGSRGRVEARPAATIAGAVFGANPAADAKQFAGPRL